MKVSKPLLIEEACFVFILLQNSEHATVLVLNLVNFKDKLLRFLAICLIANFAMIKENNLETVIQWLKNIDRNG